MISCFGQTFVRFMRRRCPQTILTDLDSGLRDAIARELPNTKHVIGIWHVQSKLSSWFSMTLGSQYAEFKAELDTLCHLESMDEFELKWNHVIARFGLVADKHIALLFSYRALWPLSLIRGNFLACAMTAEYSKSVDAFVKKILTSETCLHMFFELVWLFKVAMSHALCPFYIIAFQFANSNWLFYFLGFFRLE